MDWEVIKEEFILHPLIHTFALAMTLLHVGTGQKRQECGLKYGMFSLSIMGR